MKYSALALAMFSVGGCTHASPEVRTEVMALNGGQSITIDVARSATPQTRKIQITAPQNGIMFVHSTIFPGQATVTDLSGVRRVYLFVPEKFVAAIKEGGQVNVAKADGLQAFEYSRNDASPEDYCFQQLSEGAISMRTGSEAEVVIESRLKTPPITEPTDARCDVSEFMNTTVFLIVTPLHSKSG
ncbi:MAG: efflux RND transporter periplasmic adaptor subunit [Pseudomonadota bacterium]|nr:efflux RND transporter periplasmic adaptor subunit [Pseudomonadota bacterium]